jgi:hypothetical protein
VWLQGTGRFRFRPKSKMQQQADDSAAEEDSSVAAPSGHPITASRSLVSMTADRISRGPAFSSSPALLGHTTNRGPAMNDDFFSIDTVEEAPGECCSFSLIWIGMQLCFCKCWCSGYFHDRQMHQQRPPFGSSAAPLGAASSRGRVTSNDYLFIYLLSTNAVLEAQVRAQILVCVFEL